MEPPRFECSSRNRYGTSGDLVTAFQKKIFFFWFEHPVYVEPPAANSISLRTRSIGSWRFHQENLPIQ